MRPYLFAALLLAMPAQTHAQSDVDSMMLASQLGSVLAAEDFCGFDFDQAAIAAFIEAKVAADDMAFPSTLSTMTDGHRYQQESMSASAKTAHCTQIGRVAVSYGFAPASP
tara:strand:- start:5005 stop:5337 length:333 start_codon:yes stop_codon:yes gene_type:complete